jgi:hypothetical protein
MKHAILILALLGTAGIARAQGAPQTMSFVARLAENGTPVTGAHDLVLALYDAPTGGTSIWSETRNGVMVPSDGVLYLDLGSVTPLDPLVLDGGTKYLELAIDGVTSTPRIRIESAPYAIRANACAQASDADLLGGLAPNAFQAAAVNSCTTGQYIAAIDPSTGGEMCVADKDTTYTAAAAGGLSLAGTAFSVDPTVTQLRVGATCAAGTAIRAINQDGTVTCVPTGATYTAGTGLDLTGTQFAVDTTAIQARVSGSCAAGSAIRAIAANGDVTCQPVAGGTPPAPGAASDATAGTTSSGTFGDLSGAGAGPSVTANLPAGRALVVLTAAIDAPGGPSGGTGAMGFSVDGAAPEATRVLAADRIELQASATYLVTGLSPGSHTFTAKYRTSAGTATFSNRQLVVVPE